MRGIVVYSFNWRRFGMVTGVKELVLGIPVTNTGNMEEYEKAIEWYVNVLGCELVWKKGIANLRLASGQQILLFGADEDEQSIWYTGNIASNPHYSIQFVTANIEKLREDLMNSGVIVGDIIPGGGGGKDMMFYDPNGNRFWAIEDPK